MKIVNNAILALVATSALTVAHAHRYGWSSSCGGGGGSGRVVPRRHTSGMDLMSDMFSIPIYANTLLRQQQAQLDRMERSSPRYDISETEAGTFELSMEVPGVQAKDVSVEIVDDNRLLVSGSRRYQQYGNVYESRFDQTFSLDNVNVDELKVTLSAGILRISAPKKEKITRKLAIQEADPETISIGTKKTPAAESTEEDVKVVKTAAVEEVDGLTISDDAD
jgi:HSP20 family molecular chaperone IbpA